MGKGDVKQRGSSQGRSAEQLAPQQQKEGSPKKKKGNDNVKPPTPAKKLRRPSKPYFLAAIALLFYTHYYDNPVHAEELYRAGIKEIQKLKDEPRFQKEVVCKKSAGCSLKTLTKGPAGFPEGCKACCEGAYEIFQHRDATRRKTHTTMPITGVISESYFFGGTRKVPLGCEALLDYAQQNMLVESTGIPKVLYFALVWIAAVLIAYPVSEVEEKPAKSDKKKQEEKQEKQEKRKKEDRKEDEDEPNALCKFADWILTRVIQAALAFTLCGHIILALSACTQLVSQMVQVWIADGSSKIYMPPCPTWPWMVMLAYSLRTLPSILEASTEIVRGGEDWDAIWEAVDHFPAFRRKMRKWMIWFAIVSMGVFYLFDTHTLVGLGWSTTEVVMATVMGTSFILMTTALFFILVLEKTFMKAWEWFNDDAELPQTDELIKRGRRIFKVALGSIMALSMTYGILMSFWESYNNVGEQRIPPTGARSYALLYLLLRFFRPTSKPTPKYWFYVLLLGLTSVAFFYLGYQGIKDEGPQTTEDGAKPIDEDLVIMQQLAVQDRLGLKNVTDLSDRDQTLVKDLTRRHPACSLRWGKDSKLDVIDFLMFSDIAYKSVGATAENLKGKTPEKFKVRLDSWFRKRELWKGEDKLSCTTHPPLPDDKSTFVHCVSKYHKIHIIAIRGTSTPLDAMEDMNLYLEATVIWMMGYVFPIRAVPENVLSWGVGAFAWIMNCYPTVHVNYYSGVERHVEEHVLKDVEENGYEFFTTGHSLGGSIAKVVGLKYNAEAVTFSPPGEMWSLFKFGLKTKTRPEIVRRATSIIPDLDPVPMVDLQGGLVMNIPCVAREYPYLPVDPSCHYLINTKATLFAACLTYHLHPSESTQPHGIRCLGDGTIPCAKRP